MTRLALCTTLALSLVLACATAQAESVFQGRKGWNLLLSETTTQRVADQLRQDFRSCQAKPRIYRYDCYRRSYRTGAQELTGSRDYAPVAEALRLVERRIAEAVSANLDPSQPNLRENIFVQHRAVRADALPAIKRATLAAMDEATTMLLRTPDNAQKIHFQRVAAVIESNKVLLRSALLAPHRRLYRLAQTVLPFEVLARVAPKQTALKQTARDQAARIQTTPVRNVRAHRTG